MSNDQLTKDLFNAIVAGAMAHVGGRDGFHGLKLSHGVHDALLAYASYRALNDCLASVGGVSALSVQVSDGKVRLAMPGLWAINNVPKVLLGFNTDGPITLDLGEYVGGLTLFQEDKNTYIASYDGVTLPIGIRVHFDGEPYNTPRMIQFDTKGLILKELPGGGATDSKPNVDWEKLRDLVIDGRREFEVLAHEARQINSKEGKSFTVYLIHTNTQGTRRTLSVTPSQYNKIVGLYCYKGLLSPGGTEPITAKVLVTEGEPYNGHKTFKFTLAE